MNTGQNTPRFQTLKANVSLAQGQTLGFTKGRGYYARTAPVNQPRPQQPPGLQPLSGAEIANRIAGYVNALPAPMTDAQIQAKAQGMIDPIVQAITAQIGAGEKAGAGAISGYASELARNLAPYAGQAQQIYGGAQQAQAAADSAESQALRGNGTSLAQGLSADLSQMAGPAGLNASIAAPVATAGADAGNALLGTGSSFLDNLIAQGAAATSLAAKQPGIAGLTGLRDINNLSLSSQKQLADALSQEQQQVPGLVQNLEGQSQTNRSNRAQAAEKAREFYGARNDAILAGRQKNQAAVQVAKVKGQASVQTAAEKAAAADAKAKAPSSTWSRTNGYVSDANGNMIPGKDGQPQLLPGYRVGTSGRVEKIPAPKAPGAKPAKGSGGLTVAQTRSAAARANTTALAIIRDAAKPQKTKTTTGGGLVPGTATSTTTRAKVGSPAYYEAIHKAEAAIIPLVPPGWTPAQITRFVQRLANSYFAK